MFRDGSHESMITNVTVQFGKPKCMRLHCAHAVDVTGGLSIAYFFGSSSVNPCSNPH
jgi:hypothetical protein